MGQADHMILEASHANLLCSLREGLQMGWSNHPTLVVVSYQHVLKTSRFKRHSYPDGAEHTLFASLGSRSTCREKELCRWRWKAIKNRPTHSCWELYWRQLWEGWKCTSALLTCQVTLHHQEVGGGLKGQGRTRLGFKVPNGFCCSGNSMNKLSTGQKRKELKAKLKNSGDESVRRWLLKRSVGCMHSIYFVICQKCKLIKFEV